MLVMNLISVDKAIISFLTGSFFMLIFVIIVIRKEGKNEYIKTLLRKKVS